MDTLLRALCGLAIFIGVFAMLAGFVFGLAVSDPNTPAIWPARDIENARAIVLGGGATTASGFIGLYLIERRRPAALGNRKTFFPDTWGKRNH
jgi:nitrate reductase gamma subunit